MSHTMVIFILITTRKVIASIVTMFSGTIYWHESETVTKFPPRVLKQNKCNHISLFSYFLSVKGQNIRSLTNASLLRIFHHRKKNNLKCLLGGMWKVKLLHSDADICYQIFSIQQDEFMATVCSDLHSGSQRCWSSPELSWGDAGVYRRTTQRQQTTHTHTHTDDSPLPVCWMCTSLDCRTATFFLRGDTCCGTVAPCKSR